jgi:lipopolysaccharide export system protein LptA
LKKLRWTIALALGASGLWTAQAVPQSPAKPAQKPSQKETPSLAPAPVLPPMKGEAPPKKDPKMGNLSMVDWKHNDRTKISTGRDFTYKSDDVIFTGDSLIYNTEHKTLLASGNLKADDIDYTITGGKADVDDGKKKLAIITENVVIVMKPKKKEAAQEGDPANAKKERDRGITITCDRVENSYKKKFVTLKGHLTFRQEVEKEDGKKVTRYLTAEYAEYDGKAERLHLFKPVAGRDDEGQQSVFDEDVFVGTKEGEETIETKGKVVHTFIVPEDEEEGTPKKESPPKPNPAEKAPPKPNPAKRR